MYDTKSADNNKKITLKIYLKDNETSLSEL